MIIRNMYIVFSEKSGYFCKTLIPQHYYKIFFLST